MGDLVYGSTTSDFTSSGKNIYERELSLAIDVGAGLLSNGASVSRVECAIDHICLAYGVSEVNVFAVPTMIIASIKLYDGTEFSQMKRISHISNNLLLMEKYNQLSRDICREKYDVDVAYRMLAEVAKTKSYSKLLTILSCGIASGGYAVFFGGRILDVIPAMLTGFLIAFLNFFLSDRSFNAYTRAFVLSIIGGTASVLMCAFMQWIGLSVHPLMVNIGTVMILIPGLMICNAIRDLFAGDLFSGTIQFLNGLLIAIAIAAGYALAVFMFQDLVTFGADPVRSDLEYYLFTFFGGIICAGGFSIFFNTNVKKILASVINAVLTVTVFMLAYEFTDNLFTINLLATIATALCAEIMARIFKTPSTVFMLPSIIVLVPGARVYVSLCALMLPDKIISVYASFSNAVLVFLAMAVGLSVVTFIFQLIAPVKTKFGVRKAVKFKGEGKRKK